MIDLFTYISYIVFQNRMSYKAIYSLTQVEVAELQRLKQENCGPGELFRMLLMTTSQVSF